MIAASPEPARPVAAKPVPSESKQPAKPRQRFADAAEPITGPPPGTPPPTAAFPPAS
jgi:hypothetical protein